MTDDGPLRRIVEDAAAAGRIPGGAWCVAGPEGTLAAGAAGAACVEPERVPATLSTPYDLASLTKPLATALCAALLERDGRLDLDAPAVRLVPELAGTPYAAVTLADLGGHRAGFPAWRPLFAAGATRAAYLARLAATPPEPGARRVLYSDLGYLALGVAVERAAGASLDALFDRLVAGPLALRRTGFAGAGSRFDDAAATERGNAFERDLAGAEGAGHPYRTAIIRGHVHDLNAWTLGGVAGHAGLFGTAAEVVAIGRAILGGLGGERLLAPLASGAGRTFGFATAGDTASVRGVLPDDAVGHSGFTGTSIWLEPSSGRVHALLTNRVHPEVPADDFAPVRRAFHAAAARLTPPRG